MTFEKDYCVYIMSTTSNAILYVGITNNLIRRVQEHRDKAVSGFTSDYNVSKLVYYEQTSDVRSAIEREKQIKRWARHKKKYLVETMNPGWRDLIENFY